MNQIITGISWNKMVVNDGSFTIQSIHPGLACIRWREICTCKLSNLSFILKNQNYMYQIIKVFFSISKTNSILNGIKNLQKILISIKWTNFLVTPKSIMYACSWASSLPSVGGGAFCWVTCVSRWMVSWWEAWSCPHITWWQ